MIFKFLQKPLVIKAFLPESHASILEMHPILPSSKFIPSQWKNTPKSHFDWEKMLEMTTVRSCSGILGTFTNGYMLPLWSDLAIKTTENEWQFQFSDKRSQIRHHSNNQFYNFYEDYFFLKVDSPWILSSDKDFTATFIDPFYTQNKPKPFVTPYGVMSSINKIIVPNIFLFFKKETNNVLIKSGTPMIHFLFLTEKKVKIETEIITNQEYENKHTNLNSGLSSTFTNRRINYLNQLKKWRD